MLLVIVFLYEIHNGGRVGNTRCGAGEALAESADDIGVDLNYLGSYRILTDMVIRKVK